MQINRKFIIAAAFAVLAQPALAGVFIDRGPPSASDNGTELVNQAEAKLFTLANGTTSLEDQQNILTRFTITSAMTLNGIDIFSRSYGNPNFPVNLARPIGTGVTIKIRADAGGRPGDTNLFRLLSTISDSSVVFPVVTATHMRVHADFAETTLGPGTYWIGMSGTNISVNWTHFFDPNVTGAGGTYNLFGERVNASLLPDYGASFRLYGFDAILPPVGGTVPEPAAWAMLVIGFGLTGAAARRRQRSIAA